MPLAESEFATFEGKTLGDQLRIATAAGQPAPESTVVVMSTAHVPDVIHDPTGSVRPCNHTPTVIGNLFETPLKEMTRSEKLKTFMQARPDFCSGCKIEQDCQGGCKAAAEACYGSLHACEPFLELNKHMATKLD